MKLWEDLKQIEQLITGDWVISGDFNSLLNTTNRIGGSVVQECEYRDMEQAVYDLNIHELKKIGRDYSWSNKQVDNMICSKIDWAFGNASWIANQGNAITEILDPFLSDHSPLVLL